jgi:hypothetical protein
MENDILREEAYTSSEEEEYDSDDPENIDSHMRAFIECVEFVYDGTVEELFSELEMSKTDNITDNWIIRLLGKIADLGLTDVFRWFCHSFEVCKSQILRSNVISLHPRGKASNHFFLRSWVFKKYRITIKEFKMVSGYYKKFYRVPNGNDVSFNPY